VIEQATGLPTKGNKHCHRRKALDLENMGIFFYDGEATMKLHRGFEREKLSKPWGQICLMIMKYFTLEGQFKVYYHYHFALLNHFRKKMEISFPFFLFSSLENSIKSTKEVQVKNPNYPLIPIHQGLILRLYHFHLALCPPKLIKVSLVDSTQSPTVKGKAKKNRWDS